MGDLKNEFSWSKSRDETFQTCLRKYWFSHYGHWNGWNATAPTRTRQTYMLKQLSTRHQWAGKRVHSAIQGALERLRDGRGRPDPKQTIEAMRNAMRDDFKSSRAKKYMNDPKRICGLFEHEYGIQVDDSDWKSIADHAEACARNFFSSELYGELVELPRVGWVEIEKLSDFQLEGTKIWVQLDLAIRRGERLAIYDWKTGSSENEQDGVQIACYVLYAMDRYQIPLESIDTYLVYLADNTVKAAVMSESKLETMRQYILDSIDEMRVPLADVEGNLAVEEDFDFTDDDTNCVRCVFKKVCPRPGD